MPLLQWDPVDVMTCLEVEPEVEEYEVRYCYRLQRDGLQFELYIWPYESVIAISLGAVTVESAAVTFYLAVRGEVRRIYDKRGEYIEFDDCLQVSSRFHYSCGADDIFVSGKVGHSVRMKLAIKPHLSIRFD